MVSLGFQITVAPRYSIRAENKISSDLSSSRLCDDDIFRPLRQKIRTLQPGFSFYQMQSRKPLVDCISRFGFITSDIDGRFIFDFQLYKVYEIIQKAFGDNPDMFVMRISFSPVLFVHVRLISKTNMETLAESILKKIYSSLEETLPKGWIPPLVFIIDDPSMPTRFLLNKFPWIPEYRKWVISDEGESSVPVLKLLISDINEDASNLKLQ